MMAKNTKEKVIYTAEKLIMQADDAEVTLDQIAKALGISHAALYRHFKNKQALWEAVASQWFEQNIINKIQISASGTKEERLHDWLWAFVNAKKETYHANPKMFELNTEYVDSNPKALQIVLIPAYQMISKIMNYSDTHFEKAEAILAVFSIFTLPNFRETWDEPGYDERFERMWDLIKSGV